MPDLFLLSMLNGEVTIGGAVYWVIWNSEKQVAEVLRNGKVIAAFPYELRAHQHIAEIASLDQKDIESWKNID